MRGFRAVAIVLTFCALASTARRADAQQPSTPRIEVSGGARWNGHLRFPDVAANETTPGGGVRPLFVTATQVDWSVGASGTVGVRLTRTLRADLTVAFNPTRVSTQVTADREGISDTSAREPVTQFLIEGGVVMQRRRWQGQRLSPFVSAGGAWLRQLNDGRTLVQNGQSGYLGAGVYYVERLTNPGRIKASGIRLDVRLQGFRGGVALDHRVYAAPVVAASVFTWF